MTNKCTTAVTVACLLGVVATVDPSAAFQGGRRILASTQVEGEPDSVYSALSDFLEREGLEIDARDARRRSILAIFGAEETVSLLFQVEPFEGGASIVVSSDEGGMVAVLAGAGLVGKFTATATIPAEWPPDDDPDALPGSNWRPELLISPQGRLWLATGGLYRADSAAGPWQRLLGGPSESFPSEQLRVGTSMAFVDDSTAILGLDYPGPEPVPVAYRTVDGGRTWVATDAGDGASVEALGAIGRSVWMFSTVTRVDRSETLLRVSEDGGATWQDLPIPDGFRYVGDLYRVSPDSAYVGTSARDGRTPFWRTSDGGQTWEEIPTPHDKGLHEVPDYGVRIERIATVGDWLVVTEYGKVFATAPHSIAWRLLDGLDHAAADPRTDHLFVLTDSGEVALLDHALEPVWRFDTGVSDPRDFEKILVYDGVGYVSLSRGELLEVTAAGIRRFVPYRYGDPAGASSTR